ncbi:MAG TPA: NAD(P)-dependent oxidoreductase [Planctomycetota bacterium]|jgi:nucleoside-diphosphate-sugar epimerase|nr:NAD(P)-dependent oxidoreductase [Planctomycetota bacterium]
MPAPPLRAFEGTRALVLGASGFLGRWVARALARAGADVHVALRDPERGTAILERWGVRAAVHRVDLAREEEIARLLGRVAPAVAFNLAGYGVGRGERDEHASTVINARLPEWLARASRSGADARWPGVDFVHVGSALEYGPVIGPLSETTPCSPTTLYGRTKLAGTLAVSKCGAPLRAVTARLFTVYGAGERPGRLLPSLLAAAHGPGDVALTSGIQRRDFVCAEDAAEGLLRLALSAPRPGEIVNLATGRLASVREFASTAAQLLGVDAARLRFGALPDRDDETPQGAVDLARLRELTGWTPPDDLEAGLRRAIASRPA